MRNECTYVYTGMADCTANTGRADLQGSTGVRCAATTQAIVALCSGAVVSSKRQGAHLLDRSGSIMMKAHKLEHLGPLAQEICCKSAGAALVTAMHAATLPLSSTCCEGMEDRPEDVLSRSTAPVVSLVPSAPMN